MNPRNDEAILQQLYGEDENHRHIEDWRMKRSLNTAAYADYHWKREGRDGERYLPGDWKVLGSDSYGKPIIKERA